MLDALLPGKRLWFFATGTGIAPFASLMRDPDTYERYEQVIMMHTCRDVAELEYGRQLIDTIRADNLPGLAYYGRIGFTEYDRVTGVPLSDGTPVDRIRKVYRLTAGG